MKLSRIALTALAATVSLSAMPGLLSSALAGPHDWMSNKPYVACLKQATYRANSICDRAANGAHNATAWQRNVSYDHKHGCWVC